MAERVTVEATGQAHVEGEPDLPTAVVQLVDPWGNVQLTYRECDPWNVIYGHFRPSPSAFVKMVTTA